jgi:hypothetical protein
MDIIETLEELMDNGATLEELDEFLTSVGF